MAISKAASVGQAAGTESTGEISLLHIDSKQGEEKAHPYAIAWFQQLISAADCPGPDD